MKKASFVKVSAIVALVISVGAAASLKPVSAVSNNVFVDDNCSAMTADGSSRNPYCTIQEGVDAVAAGGTVIVAKGTYNENVQVDRTVQLLGAKSTKDATSRNVNDANESVVNGSFNLSADEAKLSGFVVQGSDGAGVTTAAAFSGYEIRNNVIRDNVFGLSLNNEGTKKVLISRNLFQNNNKDGSASGNGIYSDQRLVKAMVERNKFQGNRNASITLASIEGSDPVEPVRQNVVIERNIADSERMFANIYPTVDLSISRNQLKNFTRASDENPDASGSAIFLAGGSKNVTIERNTVRDAGYSGIRLRGDSGFGSSTNVMVARNDVRGAGDYGIGLAPTAVSDGRIERNTTRDNNIDGIGIDDGNSGLDVSWNSSFGNTKFDIRDSSAGSGDFATANTYDRNRCKTSSPDGLCE